VVLVESHLGLLSRSLSARVVPLPVTTLHGVIVRVRLFAALRERAGTGALDVELGDGANVGDVWPALALGDEPAGLVYAVNREYAERTAVLAGDDEVAVIPPVSGGDFRLSEAPLSVDDAVEEVRDSSAGAIATFVGTTRATSRGREVLYLEYEAYEGMAERVMADLAGELTRRHELVSVAIHHRVGRVEIGQTSVVIAVSAPHRAAALAACKDAIEKLKVSVPLWKKETYVGGEEWIGQGS
jgi:molybdopterin synthase catalytic subunit